MIEGCWEARSSSAINNYTFPNGWSVRNLVVDYVEETTCPFDSPRIPAFFAVGYSQLDKSSFSPNPIYLLSPESADF